MALIPQDIEKRIDIAFQKRVIDLMDEHELSKKQLAEKADISVAVISRITIYGIIPSLGILVKLADTFNISLSYLLAENNDSSFYKTNRKRID